MSIANASHSNGGGGPKRDLVSGTVNKWSDSTSDLYVHFNAQSGPEGENPRGHFAVRYVSKPDHFDATGEVQCLIVGDNRAMVFGEVERDKAGRSSGRTLEGFILLVDDNGEGKEPNDMIFAIFVVSSPEPSPERSLFEDLCPPPGDPNREDLLYVFNPGAVVVQGNFIVHDATP